MDPPSTYTSRHLDSGQAFERSCLHFNEHISRTERQWQQYTVDPAVEVFHKALPGYAETELHGLPSLAAELGVAHVLVKDESTRFGLPAFKILGASWAVHRAICERLSIPYSASLDEVRQAIVDKPSQSYRLVTCTEGNWGRAVARMAKYIGVKVSVYVPGFMSMYTQDLIRAEAADVFVLNNGTYDDCIAAIRLDAERSGALMVMDTSWDGYEKIPQWVTDGYTTMLVETDRQAMAMADGVRPNTFFVSAGVGSWAHSVVLHYMSANAETNRIVAVEPDTAACIKESLHCGELTSVATGHTIMAGMCCGTPSKIAMPNLQTGLHAAVTVTDEEAHKDVLFLRSQHVNAGPCGAATVSALRRYVAQASQAELEKMVVVLFSTEGWRDYEAPVVHAD